MPRTHSHTSALPRIAAGPSRRRRRPVPFRPRLESLEGREAPAVFEVTTTDDGGPGSLRQAVLDANANQEDDFIILSAATYQLTLAGADEDLGQTGDLDILQGAVWIIGAGAGATVIDANQLDRVFHILGAATTVVLDGVTVTDGLVMAAPARGGGVSVEHGDLYVFGSEVTQNRAIGTNGAQGVPTGAAWGGGLYLAGGGSLLLYSSAISANQAIGGVGRTVSPISGPGGEGAGGGAYIENGNALLFSSTVTSNEAIGGIGGGAFFNRAPGIGGPGAGGGLYLAGGWVQLNRSGFADNMAVGGRGGQGSFNPQGRGGPGGRGGAGMGGGLYVAGGLAELSGSLILGNQATGGAGGPGGPGQPPGSQGLGGSGYGGGVYVSGATVEIHGSLLTANQAARGAGGVGSPVAVGIGGGLYIADGPDVHVCIDLDSVILGNLASTSDPDIFGPWEPC